MTNKRYLTIHFTDGSKLSVTFPRQIEEFHQMAERIQKALDANKLAIEIDGELFVMPMNNVKYLQLTPAPEKMPETIIRDGSLINDY